MSTVFVNGRTLSFYYNCRPPPSHWPLSHIRSSVKTRDDSSEPDTFKMDWERDQRTQIPYQQRTITNLTGRTLVCSRQQRPDHFTWTVHRKNHLVGWRGNVVHHVWDHHHHPPPANRKHERRQILHIHSKMGVRRHLTRHDRRHDWVFKKWKLTLTPQPRKRDGCPSNSARMDATIAIWHLLAILICGGTIRNTTPRVKTSFLRVVRPRLFPCPLIFHPHPEAFQFSAKNRHSFHTSNSIRYLFQCTIWNLPSRPQTFIFRIALQLNKNLYLNVLLHYPESPKVAMTPWRMNQAVQPRRNRNKRRTHKDHIYAKFAIPHLHVTLIYCGTIRNIRSRRRKIWLGGLAQTVIESYPVWTPRRGTLIRYLNPAIISVGNRAWRRWLRCQSIITLLAESSTTSWRKKGRNPKEGRRLMQLCSSCSSHILGQWIFFFHGSVISLFSFLAFHFMLHYPRVLYSTSQTITASMS